MSIEKFNKENVLYFYGRTKKMEEKQGMYLQPASWITDYIVIDEKEKKIMEESEQREEIKICKKAINRYFEEFSNLKPEWSVDRPPLSLLNHILIIESTRSCEYYKKQIKYFKGLKNRVWNERGMCLCFLVKKAKNKYFYDICFNECLHYLNIVASKYLNIINHNISLYETALLYEECYKEELGKMESEIENPSFKLLHSPCVEEC